MIKEKGALELAGWRAALCGGDLTVVASMKKFLMERQIMRTF